jgi:hypothetical protein
MSLVSVDDPPPTLSSANSWGFGDWLFKGVKYLSSLTGESVEGDDKASLILEGIRFCSEKSTSSVSLMFNTLQVLETFLKRIHAEGKGKGDIERKELELFLKNTQEIVCAFSALISTRNSQERVIFSIKDEVEDGYKRMWMDKLVQGTHARVTIL